MEFNRLRGGKPRKAMAEFILNSRGLGVVEGLIAAGLMGAVAATVTFVAYSSRHQSVQMSSTSVCAHRAQSVLEIFKNGDNNINILNFDPYGATLAPTATYSTGQAIDAEGINLVANGNNVADSQVNGWLLIDSATNWARALYNNDNSYCLTSPTAQGKLVWSAGGTSVAPFNGGGKLNLNGAPINPTEKIYLGVNRYNFGTNKADYGCLQQGTFAPVPMGANSNVAYSNYGMQVTAQVSYTDVNNIVQNCSAQTTLRPAGDTIPPGFLSLVTPGVSDSKLDPNPGVCPGGFLTPRYCLCNSIGNGYDQFCLTSSCTGGAECGPSNYRSARTGPEAVCTTGATAELTLAALASEPGTIFTCEMVYNSTFDPTGTPLPTPAPPGTFTSCANFMDTGGVVSAGTVYTEANPPPGTAGLSAAPGGGIQIQMAAAPVGNYSLTIKATDSAQNSQTMTSNFQVAPACPASWTDTFCPPPAPNAADYCGDAGACPGTMPLQCSTMNPANYQCQMPVYDICNRICPFTGTGLNVSQCNPGASLCGAPVFDNCGNVCPMQGSALNVAECNPASVPCQNAVDDNCGNVCPMTGTATNYSQCPGQGSALCGVPIDDNCGNECYAGTSFNDGQCAAASDYQGPICDGCGNECYDGTCVSTPGASPSPPYVCPSEVCVASSPYETPPPPSPGPSPTPTPTPTPACGPGCVNLTCPTIIGGSGSTSPPPSCNLPGYSCSLDTSANGGQPINDSGNDCGSAQCYIYTCNPGPSVTPQPTCGAGNSCGQFDVPPNPPGPPVGGTYTSVAYPGQNPSGGCTCYARPGTACDVNPCSYSCEDTLTQTCQTACPRARFDAASLTFAVPYSAADLASLDAFARSSAEAVNAATLSCISANSCNSGSTCAGSLP